MSDMNCPYCNGLTVAPREALFPARPNVVRKDGSLWEASANTTYYAMRALFDKHAPQYFFRQVEANRSRKWWCPWRPKYVRTGVAWEGSDMSTAGFSARVQT